MLSKLVRMGLLFLVCAAAAMPALAWDDEGHMMVAYIAYQQLTPAARTRVNALIKLNPNYNTWIASLPANTSQANKDLYAFMLAATWPDEIKKAGSGYMSDGSADGDSPVGSSDPTANTGYTDKLMHKYWHFIDQPFATDGTSPLPAIPTPNAEDRIALFRTVLGSTASDDLKSYDLVWLMHLVGDVHQPLHCTTRVDKTHTDGDAGGNKVTLSCTGCHSELHAYWDDILGTSEKPKSAMSAAKKLPAPDATLAAKSSEVDWVKESLDDAEQTVYVTPVGDGWGPFSLNSKYKKNAKKLAQTRIELAGVRLGNLINASLT